MRSADDPSGKSSYSAYVEELNAELIDPLTNPEWDRVVLTHHDSNVFHLAAWARVLNSSYGHTPLYFRFSREGKLAALLPIMEVRSLLTGVRGVSLPFSDLCDPLIFDSSVKAGHLLNDVNTIASERKWKYFETRSNAFGEALENVTEQYFEHRLDLRPGVDRLFASFAPSVRRAIRKAEKSGLDVEVTKSWHGMLDFYRMHLRTRRRHGVPPQPLSFFRNIYREIISAGYGSVVVAKAANRPVAAAVFFHSGREALFKFGASDKRAQNLRPNNLVMWKGIQRLAGSGFYTLRFGRTDLHDEGLRHFKQSWGGSQYQIRYFRYGRLSQSANNPVSRGGFRLAARVFRRLPLFVNRSVGKLVYPHLD